MIKESYNPKIGQNEEMGVIHEYAYWSPRQNIIWSKTEYNTCNQNEHMRNYKISFLNEHLKQTQINCIQYIASFGWVVN